MSTNVIFIFFPKNIVAIYLESPVCTLVLYVCTRIQSEFQRCVFMRGSICWYEMSLVYLYE